MVESAPNIKLWRKAHAAEIQSSKEYTALYEQIKLELENFYVRSQSYRLGTLNDTELERFRNFLLKARNTAIKLGGLELKEKILNLMRRVKISREERLMLSIESKISEVTATLIEELDELLTKSTEDSYNATVMLVMSSGEKVLPSKKQISEEMVKSIKNNEYAGAKYDKFLKDRKSVFYKNMEKAIVRSLRSETSLSTVLKDVRNLIKRQKNYNKTLVRDQVSHVLNLSALNAMKRLEVDKFIFRAVVDNKTTKICLSMNGTVHNVSDGVPGVNMPPMRPPLHPCRSYIEPYFGGD